MQTRNNIILVLIILLIALATYIALPIQHVDWLKSTIARHQNPEKALELKLGLDLQGGTQVQLEPDVSGDRTFTPEDIDKAKVIIERRVNGLGVTEPLVQTSGERIIVALPGVDNPDQAIETLRGTGQLEFVDLSTAPPTLGAGDTIVTSLSAGEVTTDTVVYPTVLTGDYLRSADVTLSSQTQKPIIAFEFKPEGAKIFEEHTRAHVGDRLAIVMDKTILSAPVINAVISDRGIIEGDFTLEEARNLAIQMQYGALPVPLKVADVRTVGPSLGQDSVDSSIKAGIIGVIVVLLFMLIYYRLPGFLADLALLSFVALNLAVYKLIPVTLTLPGIAGFLLTTGMAVDANILIFERMREELRAGRSLTNAIEAGFSRAWTSILDSNLSTILTAFILMYFGSNFGASMVQGFAVTLLIGVLISMFTAVLVTRTLMRFVVGHFGRALSPHLRLFGVSRLQRDMSQAARVSVQAR
ncbi:MAG: protein translocase subunit SecD [Caldilineae bacterium]|nr:MAG: protein translocase subunit SecD [Caldilineae bacterium]